MSYTLDQFAADCRDALANNPGPEGLEQRRRQILPALPCSRGVHLEAVIDVHAPHERGHPPADCLEELAPPTKLHD